MAEPIDPVIRAPRCGWPRVADRVELVGVTLLRDAAYELACLCRLRRVGVVAEFDGVDLFAYPHQSCSEIERAHERVLEMQRAGLCRAPRANPIRWVAALKAGLVLMVRDGLVQRIDVLAHYGISEEEFGGWEARYATLGMRGLDATRPRPALERSHA